MSDETLITQYSKAVESYCKRTFASTSYTQYYDGGVEQLVLKHLPIVSITSITDMAPSTPEEVDSSTYDYYAEQGTVFLKDSSGLSTLLPPCQSLNWGPGRKRWKVIYTAGYSSTPDDVALAVAMLVAMTRERTDPSIQSETVGDYANTRIIPPTGWPPEVKRLLAPYVKWGV